MGEEVPTCWQGVTKDPSPGIAWEFERNSVRYKGAGLQLRTPLIPGQTQEDLLCVSVPRREEAPKAGQIWNCLGAYYKYRFLAQNILGWGPGIFVVSKLPK